jgi:pimeloyl-ACP methyl ester carboxylesterase
MSALHYTRQGAGEPVVLIHGIGHRGAAFDPVTRLLAERYDVIAVDVAGHGASPEPVAPHSYAITSHAEQLEDLFRELSLDRPHVIGNSLGGRIVLELGARGSVRSVTALAPAGFFTALEKLWAMLTLLLLKVLSYLPVTLVRRLAGSARVRKAAMGLLYVHGDRISVEDGIADTLNLRNSPGFWGQAFQDMHLGPHVARSTVPTTIAWGDRDLILLPTQARRAKRLLPGFGHVWLHGCGHVPMIDDPEGVVRVAVDTFSRAATSTQDDVRSQTA